MEGNETSTEERYAGTVLTKKAVGIIEQATKLRSQMYNIILQGVTEEEREVLRRVSTKVNENIKNALRNS